METSDYVRSDVLSLKCENDECNAIAMVSACPDNDVLPDSDNWLKPAGAECPVCGSPMWHIATEETSDVLLAAHRKRTYTVHSVKDFDAVTPQPWHAAQPGEHWTLTTREGEHEYVVVLTRRRFDGSIPMFMPILAASTPMLGVRAPIVTAGRKIAPATNAGKAPVSASTKPVWHDAKPGEIWCIKSDPFYERWVEVADFANDERCFFDTNRTTKTVTYFESITSPGITQATLMRGLPTITESESTDGN